MAVKGKHHTACYLSKSHRDFVRSHLKTGKHKGGFSDFLDNIIITMADQLQKSNIEIGSLDSKAAFNFFIQGIQNGDCSRSIDS